MPLGSFYVGREQTLIKHIVLRRYLERFAHIVGSFCRSITYIDGFAGPWNVRSDDLSDSSFSIAIEELLKARQTLSQRGRDLRLRCYFLEEDRDAYARLEAYARQVQNVEVCVRNGSFENSIANILEFIRRGGGDNFPFTFIDPTGWTGFEMETISPLLQCRPGEVLINFMTSFIHRFLEQEQSQTSFTSLFGSPEFRERISGLTGLDKEDAAVAEYSRNLSQEGGFQFVCNATVLHPERDRTHFNLIYATRHPKGVEVFKEAEKSAMEEMERARAEAQQRRREERTGQTEMFPSIESPASRYYMDLRDRYLGQSRQALLDLLESRLRVPYDEAWATALVRPLVWESDLKEWIQGWVRDERLRIEGLTGRERSPKREKDHILVWQHR